MAFSALRSLFTDSPGNPSVMGALGDPQFRQEVAGNARDASVRGAVAGALGAPVDMANSIANLGTAAYGYLGNKMGLLSGSEMPPLYQNPVGGSEWIGNQMQKAGIIGGNRNPYAEAAASIGFPMMGGALEARIPQMDRALAQAGENLAANGGMNTGQYMGQRGAVGAAGDPKLMEEVRRRGLDMSQEARMRRSAEQGYSPTLYHGTAADISEFNPSQFGGSATKARSAKLGTWLVDNPKVAGGYARFAAEDVPVQNLLDQSMKSERSGNFDEAERLSALAEKLDLSGELSGGGGQNIMPLKVRGSFLERDAEGATMSDLNDAQLTDWAKEAKAKGFGGLKINNFSDNADYAQYMPATHYLVFDPTNIRSVSAAFDPSKRNSSNLMAGVAGGAVGLSALRGLSQQDNP